MKDVINNLQIPAMDRLMSEVNGLNSPQGARQVVVVWVSLLDVLIYVLRCGGSRGMHVALAICLCEGKDFVISSV
jgi:hypothetical protein